MARNVPNLIAQFTRPSRIARRKLDEVSFCFNPVKAELLVQWSEFFQHNSKDSFVRYAVPWNSKPEIISLPGIAIHRPIMSRTGRWLSYDAGTQLRIIDWQNPHRLQEFEPREFVPVAFSYDERILLCHRLNSYALVSLETLQVLKEISLPSGGTTIECIHPSNLWLIGTRDTQLVVYSYESGNLEKKMFVGQKFEISSLIAKFKLDEIAKGLDQKKLEAWQPASERSSVELRTIRFSPDGCLMFCGTNVGLQVFDWNEILASSETTPPPLAKSRPRVVSHSPELSWVDGLALDDKANRLLFCDYDGTVQFLDLATKHFGILLDPPNKLPIGRLELSDDREFLCIFCPDMLEKTAAPCFQIWNYPALCNLC